MHVTVFTEAVEGEPVIPVDKTRPQLSGRTGVGRNKLKKSQISGLSVLVASLGTQTSSTCKRAPLRLSACERN